MLRICQENVKKFSVCGDCKGKHTTQRWLQYSISKDYPRFRPSYSCRPYSCPPYSCRDRFRSNRTDSCLALFMSKPFHAQKGLIHVWPYSCPTLFMPRRPIHVRPCSCPTLFMSRRPIHVRPCSCPSPFMSKRSFSCLTIKRANLRLPDLTYL